jgi:hypothetical protein
LYWAWDRDAIASFAHVKQHGSVLKVTATQSLGTVQLVA